MVDENHKQPIVDIESTNPGYNGWTCDGTVTFELRGIYPDISVKLPFENATSERDAIKQAALKLGKAAHGFHYVAEHFSQI